MLQHRHKATAGVPGPDRDKPAHRRAAQPRGGDLQQPPGIGVHPLLVVDGNHHPAPGESAQHTHDGPLRQGAGRRSPGSGQAQRHPQRRGLRRRQPGEHRRGNRVQQVGQVGQRGLRSRQAGRAQH